MKLLGQQEGLCRFCDGGRLCSWSRRGRERCVNFKFAHEMDCFHLWIAHFDFRDPFIFREGYGHPDEYPWKDDEELLEKERKFCEGED